MVERRHSAGLAPEAFEERLASRPCPPAALLSATSRPSCVSVGAIHLAHAARSERAADVVVTQARARFEAHPSSILARS